MNGTPDPMTMADAAALAVVARLRPALIDALANVACDEAYPLLDELLDAVVTALADPAIAWALAYLAGVRMTPDLIRSAASPGSPGFRGSPAARPERGAGSGAAGGAGAGPAGPLPYEAIPTRRRGGG